ncbi:MAG TPA: ATP-binding cassette domain-containing protein, partial [Moorella mulderi]|nr:ATP-binding cassette domain-containing protein [Moorella mulderi]
VVGGGGAGKSTLAMIMAGLLEPSQGQVFLDGTPVKGRLKGEQKWFQVGIAFQQPERQIFAPTVEEEVGFGPRNLGLKGEALREKVKKALGMVGLSWEEFASRSPFTLSGGEQRRVALASVLALDPEILILDEPTAGLDPEGREGVWEAILRFQAHHRKGVVWITHNMVEVAFLAQRVAVLHQGRLVMEGPPRYLFSQGSRLREYGLIPPPLNLLMQELKDLGAPVPLDVLRLEEAEEAILAWLKGGKRCGN